MDATYAPLLDLLRDDPRVRLVYAFGSASRDGAPRDVDIAVLASPNLEAEEEIDLRARLSAVEPRVDLVLLDHAPVVLTWEVVTSGRCLFARDVGEQAEFEVRAVSRFQDFQPVRRVQQDYLRRRVEARRGAAG